MDTFVEQLVKIKNSTFSKILLCLMWAVAVLLSLGLLCFSFKYSFLVFAVVGVIYGAIYLGKLFFIEYEYIITNGSFDIDKLTAKSTRKRLLSFECKEISRIGKYDPAAVESVRAAETVFCCNRDDQNACYLVYGDGGKKRVVVFAPNEKVKKAIKDNLSAVLFKEEF